MNDRKTQAAEQPDDPHGAQERDPASGVSDDPRVDPTPDARHGDTEHVEETTAPDS